MSHEPEFPETAPAEASNTNELPADLILVVDDDDATRYAVVRALRGAGYRVTEAIDGQQALEFARDLPDLIVLDVNLPDIDGYEVCRRLKADPLTSRVPVLQVSVSFTDSEDRAAGLEAGAEGYMASPYDPRELIANARTLIRARRLEDEASALREKLEVQVADRTRELAVRTQELAAFTAFAEFTAAAHAGAPVPALASKAVEVVASRLGDAAAAYFERFSGQWNATAWHPPGGEPDTAQSSSRLVPDPSVLELPVRRLEPVFLDAPDVPPGSAASAFKVLGLHPVVSGGEVRGVLAIGLRSTDAWMDEAKGVMLAVGRGLSLAVERADALERARQHAADLATKMLELEARNADQETFVYTVSHDLRAPLLAMQGMTELLDEAVARGDTQEASFAAGRVRANLRQMTTLLDDLLTLSRASRATAAPEALDLGEPARQALAELEPRIREREASLELPREWPRVLYPPTEAYQLLGNLLGNALKYGGRASVPPHARLSWSTDGDRITLRVEDNGPGIAPAHRERVFGLFHRLDAHSEGNGVGLAIVKRIAERHGSRVWVEDSELGGACFVLSMPAERRAGGRPVSDERERRRSPG